MVFTGGAEASPKVLVTTCNEPGLHHGEKVLVVTQQYSLPLGEQCISLSIETMKEIIRWAEGES